MQHQAGLRGEGISRLNRFRWVGSLLMFLLVVPAPLRAAAEVAFDLLIIQDGTGCAWIGPVDLDDPNFSAGCDAAFTGTMTANRVPGADPNCPAVITGPIKGEVSGSDITFGLTSGDFGTVEFTGAFTTTPEGQSGAGDWEGDPGTGTWVATDFVGFGGGAVSLSMKRPIGDCEWIGPVSGSGAIIISGTMALTQVAGDASCPPTISGSLSGKVVGYALCFEVTDQESGVIRYEGTVDREAYSGSGTWSGNSAGEGTWSVRFFRSVGGPLLDEAGLALLLGLLLAAGMLLLRRRSA